MRFLIVLFIFFSSSLSANTTINCIMIHDGGKDEVVKKGVVLEASDGLISLHDFNNVIAEIKPYAVANINGKDEIYSFSVVLTSDEGFIASAIGEEVFNGNSSVSVSLSNKSWSLLTECYQVP